MQIIGRKFLEVITPTCHASTIAYFKGEPVFAWFGGQREGMPDSTIYVQYKGKLKCKIGSQIAHWNPILFTIKDELFLAYKIGEFCDRWTTYILNITDINNIDTSKAQLIPAGLNFCVKTKPIVSKDGIVYCGSSVETKLDWTSFIESFSYKNGEFVFKDRSRPLTVPKKKYTFDHPLYGAITIITSGIIQPSLWVDGKGYWHAFFRSSRGLGKIYHTAFENHDWQDPEPTELDNPNSGVDTVCIDGRLFLVYNPSKTLRSPLVIAELNDDFEIIDEIVIQKEVEGRTHTGELSYPYMVENEGKLELVYTYGRTKIEHVTIEV